MSLSIIISIFTLIGLFYLKLVNSALRSMRKTQSIKLINSLHYRFFYRYVHQFFFPQQGPEGIFFANICTHNLLSFTYALTSFFLLYDLNYILLEIDPISYASTVSIQWPEGSIVILMQFLSYFIFGDFLPRIIGLQNPQSSLKAGSFVASIYMILGLPLTFVFLKISKLFSNIFKFDYLLEPFGRGKEELMEMIQESHVNTQLDPHDRKLIESVVSFKDRIAREVMVPRVDLFGLPSDITIQDASKAIQSEGYSRIPIYEDTFDNIIGVLMYKDVIAKYQEYINNGNDPQILNAPVKTLMKSVLYTPETKKISHLLQEFRKKQVHLAIVVDEYGGTEGIVTIEDILEEIVGDIADEYDETEAFFTALPEGGWIVDGRMNILDAEEQFDIKTSEEGDFDTIGGYIFHETGTIPPKGYILRQPDFEIEILRSNNRRVEKVRLQKIKAESTAKPGVERR